MKTFYRIGYPNNNQGLWYHPDGHFTGIIHSMPVRCKDLQMPYDEEVKGWLSATETLDELFDWFPKEDIKLLNREYGCVIQVYEVSHTKFYKPFNHQLINQTTSKLVGILTLV